MSVEKGHLYATIFYGMDQASVNYTEESKKNAVLGGLKKRLPKPERVARISMDMTKPYILGASRYIPEANIAFDQFHLIKEMNEIVDRVREEKAESTAQGYNFRLSFQRL